MKILGIDIGITSIGWAVVDDEEEKILGSGVRIFSEPTDRTGESLAAHRRAARGRRRVLRRKRQRVAAVGQLIIKQGILSKQEMSGLFAGKLRDIWQLRFEALSRKLNNEEWARVLLYLAKHRAYQSNRKSETSGDSPEAAEKKQVLGSIRKNEQAMKDGGYETVGAMLYDTTRKNRQRRNIKGSYTLCVPRDLLRQETAVLFAKQQALGNTHTSDDLREKYGELAFYQRPITFNQELIGQCTFEPTEKRAAKACYSSELFVLIGKLNNVRAENHETGEVVRLADHRPIDGWLELFKQQKTVSYKKIRKELGLSGDGWKFNHLRYIDPEDKTNIMGDVSKFYDKEKAWLTYEHKGILERQILAKNEAGKAKQFKRYKYSSIRKILQLPVSQKFAGVNYAYDPEGEKFGELKCYHAIKDAVVAAKDADYFAGLENAGKLDGIATVLSYNLGDDEATKQLAEKGVDDTPVIDKLLTLSFSGFLNLSLKAINNLLPLLKEGKKFDEACKVAYGHHSIIRNQQPHAYLRGLTKEENYQITNPSVKRAFSQFRKVVNAVVRKYGKLDAMHIELAREMKHSKKKRAEIAHGQKEFQNEKEAAKKQFVQLFGREPKPRELLKLRFYNQQNCKCVYSGQEIDIHRLNEDHYVEIDHILPWSRTFDDSLNNRALCLKSENQNKRKQTPFEYIAGGDENSAPWHEFIGRVSTFKNINRGKRNKLLNTTLPQRRGNELSDDDVENPEEGFLARNLVDTAYMARFCKNFVEKNLLFSEREDIKQRVKTRIGALTDQLRYSYGLDNKDRGNNQHHAEDAIIVAFATQGEVKRLSDLSAKHEDIEYEDAADRHKRINFTPPFDGFRNAVKDSMDNLFVSFAPRRKVGGAAHKETFYSEEKAPKPPFKVKSGYVEKGEMKRIDVFKNTWGSYALVPFYVNDFYKAELSDVTLSGKPLPEGYEFQFSLFKDDLIAFKQKKADWRVGYLKKVRSIGMITYQPHNQSQTISKPVLKHGKQGVDKHGNAKLTEWTFTIGPSLVGLKKYHVDVLGECHEVKGEKRLPTIKQMRAAKKQKMKKR